MTDLQDRERDLLIQFSEKDADVSRYLLLYEEALAERDAIKVELDGVREEILDAFLDENFEPLLLSYTIKHTDEDETTVSVIPLAGGEIEFDKFKSTLGWPDTSNVPLFYVLKYLNKGIPWSSDQ